MNLLRITQAAKYINVSANTLRSWDPDNLILTPGDVIDPTVMRDWLARDRDTFGYFPIHFDPYGFEESRQRLEEDGFETVEVTQNFTGMAPATAHLEHLITEKRIRHNNNPCANWCLGNCTVRTDPHDRIMVDKMRSKGRIDFVVATICGLTAIMGEETTDDWVGPMCGVF